MKKDRIIMYSIEISLIIFSLCFVLFTEIFTKNIMSIILLIFMVISNKFIKSYKSKGKYNKKITKLMLIIAIFYLLAIYVLGIYIGFYNATVKFSKWSLINYIIPYILIIIATENIRKTILLKENKKSNIILLIFFVIIDIALTTNIYSVKSLVDYFMLIGLVIFSSIANNLLYNYISIKYRNCKGIIVYRIITTIYVYIIPIIPNIHILLESISRIIIPYIIYLILEFNYSKKEQEVSTNRKTRDIIITSFLIILAIGILMLVSCKFKYGALVIGSGSMTGTINKGDIIIYEVLEEKENVEINDIVVFKSEEIRVIHRVIDKKDSGSGMRYYTKGDANPNEDEGYRIQSDIIGKVKIILPYLGQFTVMLNEIFN